MSQVNPKKLADVTITVTPVSNYQSKIPNVFQVDKSPIIVKPEEDVDILIDCKEGFTVFIPKAAFFGKNIFEAEDPTWVSGLTTPRDKWWGVSLTRTKLKNPNEKTKDLAYCIYSKDLDNFAVGNSPPKMKLEP